MFQRYIFAFVLLVICLPGAHAQPTEKRIALLIGNQAYDASVGVLKNPHNDIALVAESLKKQGFDILTPVKDAKRTVILAAVREFTNQLRNAGAGALHQRELRQAVLCLLLQCAGGSGAVKRPGHGGMVGRAKQHGGFPEGRGGRCQWRRRSMPRPSVSMPGARPAS